jgi:molecular chaperone DnaJ
MAKRDFYEILGVQKSASNEDTRKSYRQMAMKYQSDLHRRLGYATPWVKKG